MSEPESMRQVHEIRHKLHEKTKNMSDEDFLEYYKKKSQKAQKQMKKIKRAKNLKTFFANFDKKQAG